MSQKSMRKLLLKNKKLLLNEIARIDYFLYRLQMGDDLTPPANVTGLTAFDVTDTSFSVSWNEATDNVEVTGYKVYLNDHMVEIVNIQTYQFTNLEPSHLYQVSIVAVDAAGNMSSGTCISVNTSASSVPVPGDVTDLQGNYVNDSIALTWDAAEYATEYNIYVDNVLIGNTDTTSFVIVDVESESEYSIRVTAANASGESSGVSILVTIPGPVDNIPPSDVSNLRADQVTDQSVSLLWDAATDNVGIKEYEVYQDEVLLGKTSALQYVASNLDPDTEYTFTVVAVDQSDNKSDGIDITVATLELDQAEELFKLDFTDKQGSTSSIIMDEVHGIECTIRNVDGVESGFITDRGLSVSSNSNVLIPTASSPELLSNVELNNGITITAVISAENFDGFSSLFFIDDPGAVYGRLTSAGIGGLRLPYISSETNESKLMSFVDAGLFGRDGINVSAKVAFLANELNVVTFVISPEAGKTSMYINQWRGTSSLFPEDFAEFNTARFLQQNISIRRNVIAIQQGPALLHSFTIFDRAFSDQEVLDKVTDIKNMEALHHVSVQPSSVELGVGETQKLSVITQPNRYMPLMQNDFESGNAGYVTVDQNGMMTGITSGDTEIKVESTYDGMTYTNFVPVSVDSTPVAPPTSNRVVNGIALNRSIDAMEVGDTFVAMATTLPFDVYYDNIVVWETSAPNVCTINYGVIDAVGVGTCTITAWDATKTYSDSFTITVTEPVVQQILPAEIYHVPLSAYSIADNSTDSTNTTNGIQAALDHASNEGYKKIVFPEGTYLVNPDVSTIALPSNLIIDFNHSIINIEPNSGTTGSNVIGGYAMFRFHDIEHTVLMNAKIYGEADSVLVRDSVEGCLSIIFEGAYKCGLENCTVSKSPGFNIMTGTRRKGYGMVDYRTFEAGGINLVTGEDDDTELENIFRTNTFISIQNLDEDYLLGYYLGYFGYPYLRSRLYNIYFYDESYQFISSQAYNLQYFHYKRPMNAKYAKIVVFQENAPTAGDNDFNGSVALLVSIDTPRNCFIRDCTIEDNYSTGIAQCGGVGWVFENNTFSNNGRRMPACDIDWEDGWEAVVGDVFRYNTHNSASGVIVSGGSSIAIHDNTFNQSAMQIWGRTNNFRAYNNLFNGKGGGNRNLSLSCQADSYFAKNVLLGGVDYTLSTQHTGEEVKYKIHDINNVKLQ